MRKLRLPVLLLTVALALGLAAHVGSAQEVVIRMYGGYPFRTDGEMGPAEVLDMYLREYERLNPHVRVENLGRNLNVDQLINLYITDQMPDIIEIDVKFLADFYRVGMLAPVPDDLAAKMRENLFPSSVAFITLAGRMIGVPLENMVTGLWYSRDALEDAGVAEPPKTLREFEDMGRKLTKRAPDGSVELPAVIHSQGEWAVNHIALAMVSAEGGRIYDELGRLDLDESVLHQVLERMVTWMRPNSFFAVDGFKREFDYGLVPFGVGYPWWIQGYDLYYPGDDYTQNFGVTLFPAGRDYGAFMYAHGYGVNANSEHLDEVWKLLEWLALEEIDGITPIGHMMAAQGSLPNRPQDILADPYADYREMYMGFIANLDYARNTPDWERVNLGGAVLRVINGETHPVEAIADAIREAEAATRAHEEWLASQQLN